jgi:catechol 2,3-dioxygenase-like lactoylglutathione lyase family enzyme
MRNAVRNRVIGLGLDAWGWSVRAKQVLRGLGRPRLRALDHVTLPVRDLGVARRFYCEVLGAAYLTTIDAEALARFGRPAAPNGGEGAYHVSLFLGGSTRIDLFLQGTGQPPLAQGHPHLAFRVPPGDMLTWKARLEQSGVPTEGPLRLGPPGQASLYFNDPFGNHLEITCLGFADELPIRPPVLTGLAWGAAPSR